nr:hypothetical protein BaRGS_023221 [Batillaria attramentaria]
MSEGTSAEAKEKEEEKAESSGEEEDSENEEEEETEMPESPVDIRENIKSKFLVEMPEDFYDFWKFCEKLNKEDPLDALQATLGFTLVGPYDVLAGRHKDVAQNSAGRRPNFLLHWRYYYDPPEFLTVIKGDDEKQFHIGYFRDDPDEMPVFVAANSAKENGIITPRGDNLFAAVSHYVGERLKDKSISADKKKALNKLQESLKAAASAGGYSLEQKTKAMKERDKKSVCKTFHGAGMVVPVDDNEVGYRPVPETPGDLKKMLTKIRDSKTQEERDKHYDPLQEIITLVQFANDECDYGEGLELGLDLFTFGGKCFHSAIGSLLTLAYQLLRRPQYMQRKPAQFVLPTGARLCVNGIDCLQSQRSD